MKAKVLELMKPKVASLGFTAEELDGVATNLVSTLQTDATDEQINGAVDSVLPFLRLSQSAVTRIVNAQKKATPPSTSPEGDKTKGTPPTEPAKKDDEVPAWAKALLDDIASLKNDKVSKSRSERFTEVIKDLPEKQRNFFSLGFNPSSFKDDDEFEQHISKVSGMLPDIMQELANNGLAGNTKPGTGGDAKTEVEDFAKKMAQLNEDKK